MQSMTFNEHDIVRDSAGKFGEKPQSAPEVTIRTFSHKEDDPRYIPGVSEHDDDMSDEEWFESMGEYVPGWSDSEGEPLPDIDEDEPDSYYDSADARFGYPGAVDEDDEEVLFETDQDGIGYEVVDSGDGYTAYAEDGTSVQFFSASDDHDSIDDALRDAIAERKAERLSSAIDNLTFTGAAADIAGYIYQADNYKPAELVELLISQGHLAPGARGMEPDVALEQLAGIEGINRADEYTFDSGTFPKVILRDELTEHDLDWLERA